MPHVTLRGMNEVYWQMEMLNRQKGTENSAEKMVIIITVVFTTVGNSSLAHSVNFLTPS